MANYHETTFGDFEVDERFKKLQRSLKLAVLKQEQSKSTHNMKVSSMTAYPSWPSISSINVDTMDSCTAPSLQTSLIKSEVIASSNNLRNMVLKKKSHNTNQKAMVTSSVKQYHIQQDRPNNDQHIMPPPVKSKVYRVSKDLQDRIYMSSNCNETEKTPSLNNSKQSFKTDTFSLKTAPSWISINTNSDKIHLNNLVASPTPTNIHKIDQVFSKWKVKLNDQYELIIKGTLTCGRLARSKPIIRRYSATCIESKYKHKYILQGNITDERNALPDYIRGKFYNGFPDDWENVYQIWRTYVSQGCPVTFRWPTRITDSDDDLKTEFTDLTYTCVRNKKITSATGSCNLNEYPKTKNLTYKSDFEKKETSHNYFTHDSQNYDKNTSFIKSFISNSKKDIIPVVQTKHVKQPCGNENKQQNVKADVNSPCSSKKVKNNLKDILQEDKLNIIINNLADKNCSPKYIEKIIEMFDCLDYVVSYRTESECNNDSMISMNHETSKSETVPVQQNIMCDASRANINKLENNLTEPKSEIQRNNVDVYGHSADLGYGSLRNDSHANQLSNQVNVNKPMENDKNSDLSESETYAGVPKISIERVLKTIDLSRRIHRRKVKKKPESQKCTMNLSHSAEEIKSKSVHVANPIAKNLPSIESCVSITEDEEEITNDTRECRQIMEIARRPQEMIFSNHRETHRSNFDLYKGDKSVTQNKQPFDTFDNSTVNLNVFIKEQKTPHKVQEDTRLPFVADVDYTATSDIDVVTVSTNTETTNGSAITSHAKMDKEIVINNETNSNLPENPLLTLRREFTEQIKSETAVKKSKPTIISSMPVNLNLKISRAGSNTAQPQIIVRKEEKQDASIRPLEETDRKTLVSKTSIATKSTNNNSHSKITVDNKREICPITNSKNELKTSTATKPTINDSHSKTTVNDKRDICLITNNKSESDNIKSTNPKMNLIIEQPNNSKLGTEENPKMLTAWMPKIVHYAKSKSELGLIFQGKLLNDADHVVNRKFSTNVVLKRLSPTLIETVNHEFYKLLGPLNDNKHNIPKELVKQCRYGCPAKIEQFCLSWKTQYEIKEKPHDATMNAPVSSRGRRIIPPLCYWTGERITLKDNNLVYSPGNSQESSLLSLTDNSKEIQKNVDTEEKKKQKVNSKSPKKQSVNKQTSLPESNKTSNTNKNQTIIIKKSRDYKTSPKDKDFTKNEKKFDNAKSRKSTSNKRRLVKKLTFSTTESSEEEEKASPRKRVRNAHTNKNADAETRYTMTLRKRQKIEIPSNRILRGDTTKSRPHTICSPNIYQTCYSPTKKSKNQQITYTYYKDIVQEDFLSEDEVSCI
ncbi:uncharacterized protein LOC105839226 [Monomorium pharaonis]|uniref:uncharacterized protein LOC105839226 n=1 Tax=Monomorium pharaonis TaxID=307658 RepID=UPI00063F15C6|nr:uncharacterized protein LOC105839226 [Monomorium pharaonis]XP_012540847.1 uncharacterized protein LOC105839226 [Monomorium pharaonis]XP_036140761.1 uncharacterized protein LOC105839226 [Monomorium pharaonis]XP_036140762.1 uncharacterized protein LOC105839226 [Monomorium pharaonis]